MPRIVDEVGAYKELVFVDVIRSREEKPTARILRCRHILQEVKRLRIKARRANEVVREWRIVVGGVPQRSRRPASARGDGAEISGKDGRRGNEHRTGWRSR